MAQTILITGFAGDNVTQSTMTIPQLLEAGSDTIAIGSPITLTELKPAATILLGYYESAALDAPGDIAAGWYRGIDSGGQPWWFNVPASGRAIGQKDLPNTAMSAANVTQLLGTAWLTPGTAGTPDVNAKLLSGDATAADNAESFFDGTGYAGTGNTIPTVTNTGTLAGAATVVLTDGSLTAAKIGADAFTAAKFAADVTTEFQAGLATAAGLATVSSDLIAAINALNQSASRRVTLAVSEPFERPESGNSTYTIQGRTYTADGAAVNADSTPTLTATGIISGSLAANLSAATNPATGVYQWVYTVEDDAAIEQIKFDLSATVSAEVFTMTNFSQTADFVAATFTTADRATLDAAATAAELAKVPKSDGTVGWNATAQAQINTQADTALTDAGVTTGRMAKLDEVTAARMGALTDWIDGGRLDLILDIIAADTTTDIPTVLALLATAANLALAKADTAAILADTGTDGVVLSAAMMNKIADSVRRRQQVNVEASSDGDALSLGSEYGFIQQAQESSVSGSTLTVKKTDGATTLGTKTLTTSATADAVTGIA